MADWPTLAELKTALGITDAGSDAALTKALAAAIESVNTDRGVLVDPDADDLEVDLAAPPDAQMRAEAALLLAVRGAKLIEAPFGIAAVFDAGGIYVSRQSPDYLRLLKGSRESFGVG